MKKRLSVGKRLAVMGTVLAVTVVSGADNLYWRWIMQLAQVMV